MWGYEEHKQGFDVRIHGQEKKRKMKISREYPYLHLFATVLLLSLTGHDRGMRTLWRPKAERLGNHVAFIPGNDGFSAWAQLAHEHETPVGN
jgi:hypothetical protein